MTIMMIMTMLKIGDCGGGDYDNEDDEDGDGTGGGRWGSCDDSGDDGDNDNYMTAVARIPLGVATFYIK